MSDLVTVAQSPSEAAAQLIKLRLDDAGIPAYLANRQIHAVRDLAGYAANIWVQVASENFDQAKAILATPLPVLSVGDEVTLEMQAEAAGHCPECGVGGAEFAADENGVTRGTCRSCGARWQL